MKKRVVITGMGILSSNAHGLKAYEQALREGRSGVRFCEELRELNFTSQVVAVPQGVDAIKGDYLSQESLVAMNSGMTYGAIASIDCWKDAGLKVPHHDDETVDWDTGGYLGTGIGGMDTIGERLIPGTNAGKVRRLGSTMVEQCMASAPSANISGLLALGGQVTTNSSACSTGTEAIINAYFAIAEGRMARVLAGGTEGASPYIWAGFDAMRVLARGFNETPENASRPMSASASGFVAGAGAGVLMLESLESANARDARIYAEVLGGHLNSGGHRNGGSISAPNPMGVQRCIQRALDNAGITGEEVDQINGHLTATMADSMELENWRIGLGCKPSELPPVNSTKSLIGHCLGAAGGVECVASVLQLYKGFIHGSLNCEDLLPQLAPFADSVVHTTRDCEANILAKASFGFGDVNACILFKRWTSK